MNIDLYVSFRGCSFVSRIHVDFYFLFHLYLSNFDEKLCIDFFSFWFGQYMSARQYIDWRGLGTMVKIIIQPMK